MLLLGNARASVAGVRDGIGHQAQFGNLRSKSRVLARPDLDRRHGCIYGASACSALPVKPVSVPSECHGHTGPLSPGRVVVRHGG